MKKQMFINFMLALLLVPLTNSCDPDDCKIGTSIGVGTCAVGTAVAGGVSAVACAAGALFTFGLSCLAAAVTFTAVGAGCSIGGAVVESKICDKCASDDAPNFQEIGNKLDGIEQTQLENHLKQEAWFQQLFENDKNIILRQGEMIALQQTTVGQLDKLISTAETLGNKIDHSEIVSLYGRDFIHVINVRSKFKLLTRGTSGLIANNDRAEVFKEAALSRNTNSEDSINNIFLMLIGGHPLKKESIYETSGDKYCKPDVHKYFVDVLVESLTMHAIAKQMKGDTLSPELTNYFNVNIMKATSAYNRHCDCAPGLKKANRGNVSSLLDRLPSSSQSLFQNRGQVAAMENNVMRFKMDLILDVKNIETNEFVESILEKHSVEDIELVVASVMNKKDDLELHDSADVCVDEERNKVKTCTTFTPDSLVNGCVPPQTLEHGRFLCLEDGVTCHVVCDKGYDQRLPQTFMECLKNTWTPHPNSFKCEDIVICPNKDDLNSVILENKWSTYNVITELSEDTKRNIVIIGVREMTGHTTEDLGARSNAGDYGSLTAIANMAALLIKYFIRSSSDVKTLTYVDLRNILVVETSKRYSIQLPLQGMTDHQLLKRFCTVCTGYESLGCWQDVGSNRAIATLEESDGRLARNYKARKNAVELCFEVAKYKGYPAFAVQDGGECFASSTALETYKKYGAARNCADGKGGPFANDVYKIIKGGRCGPTDAEPHVRREGRRHASTGHVPTCSGGATLLSTSPGRDMVVCEDKTQSTCQKDFESLCPAGWNLCTPSQFNNRNDGWNYNWEEANAGQPLGAIYCRGGAGAALHIYSSNPVLNIDQRLNCGVSSSRPGCEGFAGTSDCTAKDKSALCCAPTSTCGDGLVQQEEDCDDGNNSNMDDCLNTCTWKYPGKHGLSGC